MKKSVLLRVLALIAVLLILFSDGIQTYDFLILLFAVFFIGMPWYKFFKK
ncbi:hypothetical protein SAMN02787087_01077 [Lysinibacillus sp. SG55]|nr:hypothetical protein SAMN02787078_00698 [Lysinibacillus sp. SG9]SFS52612.1 hypothetical protein SAMN02787087_01077 [Lysinibacillus sp. SG55]